MIVVLMAVLVAESHGMTVFTQSLNSGDIGQELAASQVKLTQLTTEFNVNASRLDCWPKFNKDSEAWALTDDEDGNAKKKLLAVIYAKLALYWPEGFCSTGDNNDFITRFDAQMGDVFLAAFYSEKENTEHKHEKDCHKSDTAATAASVRKNVVESQKASLKDTIFSLDCVTGRTGFGWFGFGSCQPKDGGSPMQKAINEMKNCGKEGIWVMDFSGRQARPQKCMSCIPCFDETYGTLTSSTVKWDGPLCCQAKDNLKTKNEGYVDELTEKWIKWQEKHPSRKNVCITEDEQKEATAAAKSKSDFHDRFQQKNKGNGALPSSLGGRRST